IRSFLVALKFEREPRLCAVIGFQLFKLWTPITRLTHFNGRPVNDYAVELTQQLLAERLRLRVVAHALVVAQARFGRGDVDGVVNASENVDQFLFLRLFAGPHPSRGDLQDRVDREVSTLGGFCSKGLVVFFQHTLNHFAFGWRQRARYRVCISELTCADFVEGDSDLVLEEIAEIEYDAKNSDGAGNGMRLRNDGVATHGQ